MSGEVFLAEVGAVQQELYVGLGQILQMVLGLTVVHYLCWDHLAPFDLVPQYQQTPQSWASWLGVNAYCCAGTVCQLLV